MFASFICNKCRYKMIIDISGLTDIPDRCANCKALVPNSQYLSSLGSSFSGLKRAVTGFEFCGLTPEKPSHVYKSDMKTLHNLFVHSSPEVKTMLTKILDLNFLMAYHSARDEDLEKLKEYESDLRALLKEKTNAENKLCQELLSTGED